jgi:hypothetical protein
MTTTEILDALHNIRSYCIPGLSWADGAWLTLAEFDRAAAEISAVLNARDTLLNASRRVQAMGLMLSIAIELYARAAGISWDEAEDNVKDAVMNTIEEKAGRGPDEATGEVIP